MLNTQNIRKRIFIIKSNNWHFYHRFNSFNRTCNLFFLYSFLKGIGNTKWGLGVIFGENEAHHFHEAF